MLNDQNIYNMNQDQSGKKTGSTCTTLEFELYKSNDYTLVDGLNVPLACNALATCSLKKAAPNPSPKK